MSLQRETPETPPQWSPEAAAALRWLLTEAPPAMAIGAALAHVRETFGVVVLQQLRAMAAGLAVKPCTHDVEPHDRDSFRVRSRSAKNAEGEFYVVDVAELTCPCKSFEVRRWCSHLDSAIAFTP